MSKSGKTFLRLLLITGVAIALLLIIPPVFAVTVNPCPREMAMIPPGTFTMGSDNSGLIEELSAQEVTVSSFCIDKYEVTNTQFAAFVKATGYVTLAERPLSKEQFPDLPDEQRLPGSVVFEIAKPGAKLLSWWHWQTGANWQHPFGRESALVQTTAGIAGQENYPVVHIAYEDAAAYAQWAGKSLPTEVQWEYAARGGLDGATYSWGNQYSEKKANTWQGIFPFFNTKSDGYLGIAPVGSFPPNGYGLYDITGNVWEWTSDWFSPGHNHKTHSVNPTGPKESYDPNKPTESALHVIKGGSYLCAPNYCSRFRPAARESQAPDTGTTHIGFRLVKNLTTERIKNEV
ncbi:MULTISPECIES: formylglycine-generating enzyme family protein [unclassified Nostoc]|uniref:formylglycine-generating enzyme family protein n=1 Tax=unclassified Nostoc TaxID=2593658 RepID=UPI00262C16E3|nr:formylglycine-generating enzyme family protein [Nostoc sp. S13]MDF5739810.1 formylglycine-generating enzyme family protein [Nostoc sp. S13]